MNKAILVQRHVTTIEETSLLTDTDQMTKTELLNYINTNQDTFEWDEVDVITHFKIVENYA